MGAGVKPRKSIRNEKNKEIARTVAAPAPTPNLATLAVATRLEASDLENSSLNASLRASITADDVVAAELQVASASRRGTEVNTSTPQVLQPAHAPVTESEVKFEDDTPPKKRGVLAGLGHHARQFLIQTQITTTTITSGSFFVYALKAIGADTRALALSGVLMGLGTIAGLIDTGILRIGRPSAEKSH